MTKKERPLVDVVFDSGGPKDLAYETTKVPEPPPVEDASWPPPRAETGPLQFGEDWPGTYIRGDDSFHFQTHLEAAIEYARMGTTPDGLTLQYLKELSSLLGSSKMGEGDPAKLMSFPTCLKPPK